MNFFSSDEFLDVVARVYYPKSSCAIESVHVGDAAYRLLIIDGKRVVSACPFLDFVEPMSRGRAAAGRKYHYLPRVSRGLMTADAWMRDVDVSGVSKGQEGIFPAPTVFLQGFASWEQEYVQYTRSRNSFAFNIAKRKQRKLSREAGDVRFEFDSNDPCLIPLCRQWKSQQYRDSKLINLFSIERVVAMFDELYRKKLLTVSAVYAGDVPVAVHLGVIWNKRFYYWVPAYDPAYRQYSPGTICLEGMLREAYARKLDEFDFLNGDEAYKWTYATHTRLIGPVGRPPLRQRIWKPLRSTLMKRLRQKRQVYSLLQDAKRSWQQFAMR